MTTPSLAHAYNASKGMGTATPIDAELQISRAEVHRLTEQNRHLGNRVAVLELALRQMLAWVESENQHRKKLGDTLTNIRVMLGDK